MGWKGVIYILFQRLGRDEGAKFDQATILKEGYNEVHARAIFLGDCIIIFLISNIFSFSTMSLPTPLLPSFSHSKSKYTLPLFPT